MYFEWKLKFVEKKFLGVINDNMKNYVQERESKYGCYSQKRAEMFEIKYLK